VFVRYDPDDLEFVEVFSLADEHICTAARKQAKGVIHADVKDEMRLKAQHRNVTRALIDTSDVLLADDPLAAVARRRQATRREAAERADRNPPPPGSGQPNIRIFRSALADTAEALARMPKSVGAEGTRRLPGGERVDADGTVLNDPRPGACTGDSGPSLDELFDDLKLGD